jgi:RND family efflux transporter MFP subunit
MKKFLKTLLFAGILAVGVLTFGLLRAGDQTPSQQEIAPKPAIVLVTKAARAEKSVEILAMGTVIPARSVTVFPEVSGKIVYQSPDLLPGGKVRAGQVLAKIDPRDYDLSIKQQRALVSQAQLKLAREKGQKAVAEKEWKLIKDEVQPTEMGRSLALREVHMESAKAELLSAESALQIAQLRRSRTILTAPFNAIVTQEFIDPGQVVSGGTAIAKLVDADKFWVRVSISMDRLHWIQIPGINAMESSLVTVIQRISPDRSIERFGKVVCLLGDLDPKGKMARLLIQVDHPLDGGKGDLPLLLGSLVSVQIQGPKLDKVIKLPRMALREHDRVWIKNTENKLEIRDVQVIWSKDNTVFVKGDIKPGQAVISSRIVIPVAGMALLTEEESLKLHEKTKTEKKTGPKIANVEKGNE